MENINVKNIIISKQYESCGNFEEFLRIVTERKINVIVVNCGERVTIEKDLYFHVLWPDSNNFIAENALNNNSLVCKLCYNNFSCLFTGDIEEIAEEQIIEKYKNTNILKATILKVAHHGSKSSSIQSFLEQVQPQIALIGVGKNNTFKHPNDSVLQRLKNLRSKDL